MMQQSIGVGWDVGGWLGPKQAVAVVQETDGQLTWLGVSQAFSIRQLRRAGGSVLDLIRLAWPSAPANLLDQYRVTLAIDAPLGFPIAFQQLLGRQAVAEVELTREIDNHFAYRETERCVYQTFGKKPLSAPFDKLGNNATVAMYHVARWSAMDGFRIVPLEVDNAEHAIIEVYPALVRIKDAGALVCAPQIARLLPAELVPGSDEHDAAICALHALTYALRGEHTELPRLVGPPGTIDVETLLAEGWIYHMPRAWLHDAG